MRTIQWCCRRWELRRRGTKEALLDFFDEVGEWIHEPSWDEFHDVLWTLGRFAFDALGVGVFPVTGYAFAKYEARYQAWKRNHAPGCVCMIRSRCKCGASAPRR